MAEITFMTKQDAEEAVKRLRHEVAVTANKEDDLAKDITIVCNCVDIFLHFPAIADAFRNNVPLDKAAKMGLLT